MKLSSVLVPVLATLALSAPVAAHADGDAAAGKQVFNKCRACHTADKEQNKIGPYLLGVVGRTAGTVESFQSKYSPNMKEAGAEGLVWDEENLAKYLRAPKSVIPKGRMAFPGLKDDQDIADVIAYLKADPKP